MADEIRPAENDPNNPFDNQAPEPLDIEGVLEDPISRMVWEQVYVKRRTKVAAAEAIGVNKTTVYDRLRRIALALPDITPEQIHTMKQEKLINLETLEADLMRSLSEVLDAPVVEMLEVVDHNGEPLIDENGMPATRRVPDTLGIQRMVNSILRVHRERAVTFGLDAPKRIEVEGVSNDPLKDEAARASDAIEAFLAGVTIGEEKAEAE